MKEARKAAKIFMKAATSMALAIALICSTAPAQPTTSAAAKVRKMTLNKTKLSLEVGDTATIKVKKVTPKKASKAVTFKTNNKIVASVSKKGKVTANKAGSAKITVTSKSNKKLKKAVKVIVRDGAGGQAQGQQTQNQQVPGQPVTPPNPPSGGNGGTGLPQATNGAGGNGSVTTEPPIVSDEPGQTEKPEDEQTPTPKPEDERTPMPEPEDSPTPKPMPYPSDSPTPTASPVTGDGFVYDIINGEIEIVKYLDYEAAVIVPEYIKGYPVTRVGSHAFSDCNNMISIELSTVITYVGDNAFDGADSLSIVYYDGSREQWQEIDKGVGNDALLNADIYFLGDQNEGTVICDFDFEDGNVPTDEHVSSSGATFEIVDMNSQMYDDPGSKCLKVSDRALGMGWWERIGFCYNMKDLEPGKKYDISVDVYHENEAATTSDGSYDEVRAFKMDTYFAEGEQDYDNLPSEDKEKVTPMYSQVGDIAGCWKGEWERIAGTLTVKEDTYGKDYILTVFMGYPEATDANGGAYVDENTEDYYIDNFIIKERAYVAPTPTRSPDFKPRPTVKPFPDTEVPTYPPGYVYKQRSKMVTRWYNDGMENGHHHDGYKSNNFAIWMIGFFDNNYDSTDEESLNEGIYGPDLDDYKGKELTVKGEFMYDGHDQPTVLLQLNYTKPVDYPIVWKWEKNASQQANEYAAGLKMKGVNGSENVNHGEWANVNATFTIPYDAVNGDKNEDTGEAIGIYLYFPNRPGGAFLYRSDNTFHFRNFEIK